MQKYWFFCNKRDSQYACLSKNDFKDSLVNLKNNEQINFDKKFKNNQCYKIPANELYFIVLKVDNDFFSKEDSDYIEIGLTNAEYQQSYWTHRDWVKS
jgi:hypothetical protein